MQDVDQIFVSYHRADGAADAGRLADTLRVRFGEERVFIDVSAIEAGANWKRVVDKALQSAVALLLVIGPAWELTDPIKREVAFALDAGVVIIPILVRGATWETAMDNLPSELQSIRELNAMALDHGRWSTDVEPLLALLERLLKDPVRARSIVLPPDPVAVLSTAPNWKNIRSMLVHAADLADCLDDPSILNRARQAVPVDSQASELPGGIPEGLVSPLVDARYRLMVEEVGRELLKHGTAERVAEFLGDSALVEKIRKAWHEFEVEKRGWFDHRGDGSEDPGARQQEAMQLEARARGNLQAQLPGLTKHSETRQRLFEFVADQVTQILSTGVIRDFWEYTFLKQFSAYPDMPWELRVGDREKVESMLKRFEEPARD